MDSRTNETGHHATQSMPGLALQDHSHAFETLLIQEGLAYGLASPPPQAYADGARIFILNKYVDESYLSLEGPCFFIVNHIQLGRLLNIEANRVANTLMFSMAKNAIFSARSFYVDFPAYSLKASPSYGSHSSIIDSSIANSGIHITRIRHHWLVSLPWNLDEWKHEMTYRPYYSRSSNKHFYEIGARVDWGAFRRMLKEILLVACKKLKSSLWARKGFPQGKRVFSVRVDADGFSHKSTDICLKIASQQGLRFDWFIDVGSWNGNYSQIKRLYDNGQSIGLHDFYHMTYRRYRNNLWNMRKGSDLLARVCGKKPAGVVSPFGYYFDSYQKAIKDIGFTFSSEFGYDTDNLPSYPHNNPLYPLQIPVHPGSIGTLEKAGFSDSEIIEHLHETALRQSSLDGYTILYDHPIRRLESHSQAYSNMLGDLVSSGLDYATMTEIASFWNSSSKLLAYGSDSSENYHDEFVLPEPSKHVQHIASHTLYKQVNDRLYRFLLRSKLNSIRSYLRSK